MDNVAAWSFDSKLTLDQMLAALTARVTGVEWGIRESDSDGRYVKGMTREGVKIRILEEEGTKFSVEVYYPLSPDAKPLLSDADKRSFAKRLDAHVLAAIKATNVTDS